MIIILLAIIAATLLFGAHTVLLAIGANILLGLLACVLWIIGKGIARCADKFEEWSVRWTSALPKRRSSPKKIRQWRIAHGLDP